MKSTQKYISFVSLLAGMISLASLREVDAVKKSIKDAAVPSSSDSEKKDYREDRKTQEKGGSLRSRAELRYEISVSRDGKTEIIDKINGKTAVLDPQAGAVRGKNLLIVNELIRRLSSEVAQSTIATVEVDQPQGELLAAKRFSYDLTSQGKYQFSETGLRGRYLLTTASGLDGAQAGENSASISGLSGDSITKMERSVKESNFKEGLEYVRMFHAAFGSTTTGSFNNFGRSSTRAMQAQSSLFAEKSKNTQEGNDWDLSQNRKLNAEMYSYGIEDPQMRSSKGMPNIVIDQENRRLYFRAFEDLILFRDKYQGEASVAVLVAGKFDWEGFQGKFNLPVVATHDGKVAVMLSRDVNENEALGAYFRDQGVDLDYAIASPNHADFSRMRERLGAENPSIYSAVPQKIAKE